MSLSEFQAIFWWEWFHRLFAHLIGVVFIVPFLWFWLRGAISRSLMPRLLGLFLLGGLQGVVGWLMVKVPELTIEVTTVPALMPVPVMVWPTCK